MFGSIKSAMFNDLLRLVIGEILRENRLLIGNSS